MYVYPMFIYTTCWKSFKKIFIYLSILPLFKYFSKMSMRISFTKTYSISCMSLTLSQMDSSVFNPVISPQADGGQIHFNVVTVL